jgi:hypothetical protein
MNAVIENASAEPPVVAPPADFDLEQNPLAA